MSRPLSRYAQSRPSGQSSAPPNPSNASGQSYEQRGLPESAYDPYRQTELYSEFGLGQMAKPQIGESYCGRALSPNPPPYPQSRPTTPADQTSCGCFPAPEVDEISQAGCPAPSLAVIPPSRYQPEKPGTTSLSVSGRIRKERLNERDEGLFSALPGDHMRGLVDELYQGSLR
jgi:hypothetical protein